jgi:hypothetical protein
MRVHTQQPSFFIIPIFAEPLQGDSLNNIGNFYLVLLSRMSLLVWTVSLGIRKRTSLLRINWESWKTEPLTHEYYLFRQP